MIFVLYSTHKFLVKIVCHCIIHVHPRYEDSQNTYTVTIHNDIATKNSICVVSHAIQNSTIIVKVLISSNIDYIKMQFLFSFQSNKVFLIRGGYRRIRKCLRQRGWVEQEYYRNTQPAKSTNERGNPTPKKGVEISPHPRGCVESSDDDSDADADGNDGDAVSEEEYSDEEEYCMLVWM